MWQHDTPAVEIPPGTVVDLSDGEWRYGAGALGLRVNEVRWDLARYYDGEVWVHGYRLDVAGVPIEQRLVLVSIPALLRGLP